MSRAELLEKRRRNEVRCRVRMRESRLTIALAALKLIACHGRLVKAKSSP
jgi:hypothetical protein